jgi:hypothetical protein
MPLKTDEMWLGVVGMFIIPDSQEEKVGGSWPEAGPAKARDPTWKAN